MLAPESVISGRDQPACPGAEAGRGTPCSQRSSSARCSSPSRSEVPPASSLCAFVYLACPPAASPAPTLRCAAMRLIVQRVRISRAPPAPCARHQASVQRFLRGTQWVRLGTSRGMPRMSRVSTGTSPASRRVCQFVPLVRARVLLPCPWART